MQLEVVLKKAEILKNQKSNFREFRLIFLALIISSQPYLFLFA